MLVSVILPAKNEAENIPLMVDRLRQVLDPLADWEIIFVDDGSSDGSLELLRALHAADGRVGYVSFTRNFGTQSAIRAGLAKAAGDCAVIMDADLQQPPELIPDLVEAWKSGSEIVSTIRKDPAWTPLFKKKTSSYFYRVMNRLSDIRIEEGASDFRLLSRKAMDMLLAFPERYIFWRGAVAWTGLKTSFITYEPAPRIHGTTKFPLKAMFRLALEGITSFSVKPLRFTAFAGGLISLVAFLYAIYALAMRVFTNRTVEGWTSLLISVLLLGGIQLLSIGILGEYLGKLFMEAKGRPSFLVAEESRPAARKPAAGADKERK